MVESKKRKIAIIGLDGAGLDLIKPWIRTGFLPNFEKILTSGVSAKLKSVIPPLTASAWTTLYTGKNPGKHGLFDFITMRPNSYAISPTSFADNKAQTFWEIVNSFGKKVAILNAPFTYPPRSTDGILVSGLQTPPQALDFTYPQSLRQELDKLVGRYAIYPIEFNGNRDEYLSSLYEVTEKKFKIFLHYFKQKNWDIFMGVFQGTDFIQHQFWQYMDEKHPYYQEGNIYKEVIKKFYQRIDSYLGQFMKYLDEKTTMIIVSDHGACALHKYIYINNWLYKWGMIKFKQNPKVFLKKIFFSLNFAPADIYNFLFARKDKSKQGKRVRHFFSFRDIDWTKTAAFSFTNNGQIFINLRRRQPQGCVEPGKEYEKICDEIVRRLYEIKDPETEEQVIEKVYKGKQIYSGEQTSSISDIVWLSDKGRYMSKGGNKFYSNKLIERCPQEDVSGAHSLYGMGLFYGNGINQSKSSVEDLHLQDIAPMVLAILGLDIPVDMDGNVKEEIFQEGFLKELNFSPVKTDKDRVSHDYSQAESEAIQKRLRELGYID